MTFQPFFTTFPIIKQAHEAQPHPHGSKHLTNTNISIIWHNMLLIINMRIFNSNRKGHNNESYSDIICQLFASNSLKCIKFNTNTISQLFASNSLKCQSSYSDQANTTSTVHCSKIIIFAQPYHTWKRKDSP